MLFLIVALPLEARPLIRAFALKKDMTSHPFPLYRRDDCFLIISGVGKVLSAMAVTWLQAWIKPAPQAACWVNIGFCGTDSQAVAAGTLVQAGKITDLETGRDFYPDPDASFTGETIALSCCTRHMTVAPEGLGRSFWCDMESAGFMEAASRFAPANQIHVLKIVSDHLESLLPDKNKLSALIEQQLSQLSQLLPILAKPWQDPSGPHFPAELLQIMAKISRQHHFTVSMNLQLQKALQRAVAAGCDPLPALQAALQETSASKQEGKRRLAGLIQVLHDS